MLWYAILCALTGVDSSQSLWQTNSFLPILCRGGGLTIGQYYKLPVSPLTGRCVVAGALLLLLLRGFFPLAFPDLLEGSPFTDCCLSGLLLLLLFLDRFFPFTDFASYNKKGHII